MVIYRDICDDLCVPDIPYLTDLLGLKTSIATESLNFLKSQRVKPFLVVETVFCGTIIQQAYKVF